MVKRLSEATLANKEYKSLAIFFITQPRLMCSFYNSHHSSLFCEWTHISIILSITKCDTASHSGTQKQMNRLG